MAEEKTSERQYGCLTDDYFSHANPPEGGANDLAPFSWMIRLYQKYISPTNDSRCPMHPSCSEFAIQALRDEGPKGLVMIFDRLLRCGRDLEDYPIVIQRGHILHYDPVTKRLECKINEPPK
jgi:hypothetical protein